MIRSDATYDPAHLPRKKAQHRLLKGFIEAEPEQEVDGATAIERAIEKRLSVRAERESQKLLDELREKEAAREKRERRAEKIAGRLPFGWISSKEAIALSGLSKATIGIAAMNRVFESKKLGHRTRIIKRQSLLQWLELFAKGKATARALRPPRKGRKRHHKPNEYARDYVPPVAAKSAS